MHLVVILKLRICPIGLYIYFGLMTFPYLQACNGEKDSFGGVTFDHMTSPISYARVFMVRRAPTHKV